METRPGPAHDFEPRDADLIRDLSRNLETVGRFALVLGALGVLGFVSSLTLAVRVSPSWLTGLATRGLVVAFCFFVAFRLRSASEAFRLVTDTTGDGVPYLMAALRSLNAILSTVVVLAIVAVGLFLLALLANLAG